MLCIATSATMDFHCALFLAVLISSVLLLIHVSSFRQRFILSCLSLALFVPQFFLLLLHSIYHNEIMHFAMMLHYDMRMLQLAILLATGAILCRMKVLRIIKKSASCSMIISCALRLIVKRDLTWIKFICFLFRSVDCRSNVHLIMFAFIIFQCRI